MARPGLQVQLGLDRIEQGLGLNRFAESTMLKGGVDYIGFYAWRNFTRLVRLRLLCGPNACG